MKRIISILLTFSILAGMCVSVSAGNEKQYSYASSVISNLGIIPETGEEGGWQKKVTRAEMAEILYRLFNYNSEESSNGEWSSNFYGNKDDNTAQLAPIEDNERFSDVNPEQDNYKYIKFVSDVGLMNGYDNNTFGPDDPIMPMHAVKILVDFMGFRKLADGLGGYETGYRRVSEKFNLMMPNGSSVTKEEMAQLLYNVLTVEFDTTTPDEIKLNSGTTLLNKYLKIDYVKGTMTDNGYVSLTSKNVNSKNTVIVEGTKIEVTENTEYIRQFIGREVEIYYGAEDSINSGKAIFAVTTGNDEVKTILGRDVESYSSGNLTYKEGSKTKNIRFDNGVSIVYNNTLMETYTRDLFLSDSAVIDLITPKNKSNVYYVVIKDYESVYVSGIDESNKKIYNKLQYAGEERIFDFDDANRTVIIYKADGNVGTFDDITTDTILDIYQNDDMIVAKICEDKVSAFKLSYVTDTEYGKGYGDGENEYNIYPKAESAINLFSTKIGNTYTVYLNLFGDIVWMTDISEEAAIKYGFAIKAMYDMEKDKYMINVLNEKNEWVWLNFAEKTSFNNANGEEQTLKDSTVYKNFYNETETPEGHFGIVRYKLDEAGDVSYIEVPITNKASDKDNKLRLLGSEGTVDKNGNGKIDDNEKVMWRDGGNIGPNMIIRGNDVKVIARNSALEKTDREAYQFTSVGSTFRDAGRYSVTAYTTKADSRRAEFVIMDSDVKDNIAPDDRSIAVVIDKKIQLNEDSDAVLALKVFDLPNEGAGSEKTLYYDVDVKTATAESSFPEDVDESGAKRTYEVDKGDIIRYSLDSYGKLKIVHLVWDADKEYDLKDEFPNSRPGGLAGVKSYYVSGEVLTNPCGLVNADQTLKNPKRVADVNMRLIDSYAYKIIDGAITVTTQNLPATANYDKTESDTRFLSETYLLPSFSNQRNKLITVTKVGDKDVSVKAGDEKDIKTFDEYGTDCSRIVFVNGNGNRDKMVIINEE